MRARFGLSGRRKLAGQVGNREFLRRRWCRLMLVNDQFFGEAVQRTRNAVPMSNDESDAAKCAASIRALVLLCHKFRLLRAAQHGQRESVVARAATNLRRIVAIEFGTWRSGRNGGSSGLVTFA